MLIRKFIWNTKGKDAKKAKATNYTKMKVLT